MDYSTRVFLISSIFSSLIIFTFIIAIALWRRSLDERNSVGHVRHGCSWKLSHILITHNNRLSLLSAETTNEYCEDGEKILKWIEEHPYGAVTSQDHEEYRDLITNQVGSYMIWCAAHGIPFSQNHIDCLWDSVEDWRM